jgi:hypothetical protein
MQSMNPDTADLVRRFSDALVEKLARAEKKYGYSNDWLDDDWMDECRAKLRAHVDKGDPLDVAAYCAFLWHHNEPTTFLGATPVMHAERVVSDEARERLAFAICQKRAEFFSRKHPEERAGAYHDGASEVKYGPHKTDYELADCCLATLKGEPQ